MLRAVPVHPNAENATLDELKVAMEAAPNKRSCLRLAAIRSLLLGIQRATVCQQFCRTDRMLRLWIELFNSGGIDALITRPRPGRPRKVKRVCVRDLLVPVLENPATAGQIHWTGVKLHGHLQGTSVHRAGLQHRRALAARIELPPAPAPALARTSERGGSKEISGRTPCIGRRSQSRAVVWRRIRGGRRSASAQPHIAAGQAAHRPVSGRPHPAERHRRRGSGQRRTFSLIVDGVDTEVFQFFLDEMARAVPRKEGVRQMLILDNASWHKSVRLHWHHFEPKFLPGYSPDFNPIERLWLRLKADWSWDFIARTAQELSDRLCLPSKASSTTRQNRLQLLSPEMTFENRSRGSHQ